MSEKRQSSKRTQQSRHRAQDARDRLPPLHVAVKKNDEAAISTILKTHPETINSPVGEFQSTPLHLACRRGFTKVAQLLVEAGAQINTPDSSSKTALHWACSGDHVETVRYLLSLPACKISSTTPDSKRRFPLHLAVAMAPKETIRLLLSFETSSQAINAKDVHGSTPLHVAVRYHREEAEELLLARTDVNVDTADRRGRTPLHYAAQLGREKSVKRLLGVKASPNSKDSAGDTPLHYACHAGAAPVVHALIAAKADVNAQNNKTFTPMHIAVELENDTICHILTQSGADIGIRYDSRFYQQRHQKHVHQMRASIMPDDEDGPRPTSSALKKRSTADSSSDDDAPTPSSKSERTTTPEMEYLSLKLDRYGYIIKDKREGDDDPVNDDISDPKAFKTAQKLQIERTRKWIKMLKKWSSYSKKKKDKVARRVWKGIPDPVRGQAWRCFMSTETNKRRNQGVYADLLKKHGTPKVLHQIDLDINRSARNHVQFYERFGPGQISLFNILKAYSIHDPVVEYCQSMSDVTAFVLMQIEEEEAFWFLVEFLQSTRFGMGRRYENGFPGLYESFYVYSQLLKRFHPQLAAQFDNDGLLPVLYTMNWFMKIFIDGMPAGLLLRMWDLMLYFGFDIVYSFIVVLVGYHEPQLLGKRMDEAMMFLQRIRGLPAGITVDKFFEDVKALNIKSSLIREYEAAFNAQAAASSSSADRVRRESEADRANRRKEIISEEKVPDRQKQKRDDDDYSQDDVDASAISDEGMTMTFNPLNMELPPPMEPSMSDDVFDKKDKRKSRAITDASAQPEANGKNNSSLEDASVKPKDKRKSRIISEDTEERTAKREKRKSRVVETS